MNWKKLLSVFKDYTLVTLGMAFYVLGWTIFLVPNNMVGGGVSGIASMVQYATHIPMGYTYFAINAILLIIGFATLGKGFGVKTVYAIIICSAGLNWTQVAIPQEIIVELAVNNGKLLCTIMGGLMVGSGIGISMHGGGSSGGTDIIALILNKYKNIPTGKSILWMDVVIILSSLLVPSFTETGEQVGIYEKITTVVFGIIFVVLNGYVIDIWLSGAKQSVQVFIMSHRYAEIADAITNDLHRGVTVLPSIGWYTKEEGQVLMVIIRKTDLNPMLKYIKNIDPSAFFTVGSVSSVYGKGFDRLKGVKKVEK
ncbi:MAG: YitT family protein [Candidatus Cryptobacteroides sp.]